jgi:uncharacterized protein YbjQ (UPF0145 family)
MALSQGRQSWERTSFGISFASIRDIVGGRSGSYERVLRSGRDSALEERADEARMLGANAVVGVDLDYGALGATESMLMVTATGTAVTLA